MNLIWFNSVKLVNGNINFIKYQFLCGTLAKKLTCNSTWKLLMNFEWKFETFHVSIQVAFFYFTNYQRYVNIESIFEFWRSFTRQGASTSITFYINNRLRSHSVNFGCVVVHKILNKKYYWNNCLLWTVFSKHVER